jgi:hypothetical protein
MTVMIDVGERAKSPRDMVGQRPGQRLLVDQFKPKRCPRQTPDQQPLREARRAADLRNCACKRQRESVFNRY